MIEYLLPPNRSLSNLASLKSVSILVSLSNSAWISVSLSKLKNHNSNTSRGFFLSFSTLGLCCVWLFPSYSAPKNPKIKTHQTQISLFYKTHQCLEKLEKEHWNTNKSKIEHLNKNFEIQTLKFRGIQNRARWVYGGRERKRGHLGRVRSWWTDRFRRRWEMSLSVVLGLRWDGFFSQ